ncbi:hypothetical protein [Streptosporangium sp. NPDC048865]|uniref:hypothetical protein n=1 Tax=Streptosporangium sp. NPDC048865 TaxID=3155766 RepID=UPI00342BD314
MSTTLDEILRSPVGRNSTHWLKFADEWWSHQSYWNLHEMCVVAALRVSEGVDGPDEIPLAADKDTLTMAQVLADVVDHHPISRHLTKTSSPQVHFGSPKQDVNFGDHGGPPLRGKPPRVLWTSSLIDTRSSWLAAIDSSFVPVNASELKEHHIVIDAPKARIFNIDGFEDVATLAELYGIPRNGQAQIDWTAVRADHDAVHLSFRGLLTAQGVPVSSTNGIYSLTSWDCESTAWFNSEHFTRWTQIDIQDGL